MSDDQVTNEHIDGRFDRLERQIEQVSQKADRNHSDTEAQFMELGGRVAMLEERYAGHSDEQIEQMIDDRLAVWVERHLTPMVREVLNAQLKVPLAQIAEVKQDTEPIVEMAKTVQSIRKAIVWVGAPAGAIAAIAGVIVIMGQVF